MPINLCAEELVTNGFISIECPQISPDSHSVANLYSSDPGVRRLGFRTEHFVRPPVELTIRSTFIFDLRQLEMGLKLNDNKSESLEVYSSYDSKTYQLIAKQFNIQSNDSICLKNVCYRPNGTVVRIRDHIPDHSSAPLVVKCFKNCFRINSIKIKILRTANSSIPCLSYLKIFGQPVRQTSKEVLNKIREIYSKRTANSIATTISFYNSSDNQFNDNSAEPNLSDNRLKRRIESNDQLFDNQFQIPEEFIDLITNEVMIDPILLPSGHSVDKTTLDKYLSEEAKWCRPPSDPFTQMVFTADRQPKPNYILRQRIDAFLSQTCDQTADERLDISKKRRIVGSNHVNNETLVSSKLLSNEEQAISDRTVTKTDQNQSCVECQTRHPINDYSVLYRLVCNHVICRQKLTEKLDKNLKSISCNQCKCETPSDRIIKLNRNR